jgi:hypothetical protein
VVVWACLLSWHWFPLVDWCRPSPPPPGAVATSAVVGELRGQLLAWERELDSREGAISVWEDGLVASECTLGRACVDHDAACA